MAQTLWRFIKRMAWSIKTGDWAIGLTAAAGGICVAVLGNEAYAELSGDDKPDWRHAIVAGGAIVLAVLLLTLLLPMVRRLAGAQARSAVTRLQPSVPRHRGLVVVVSVPRTDRATGAPLTTVAELAINYHLEQAHAAVPVATSGHRLEHCWLLATNETMPTAERLKTSYEQTAGIHCHIVPLPADAKIDPAPTYHAVKSIYHQAQAARLDPQDLVADITGGTKPITVGMFQACFEADVPMQYVDADYGPDGSPTPRAIVAFEFHPSTQRSSLPAESEPIPVVPSALATDGS